jgi:putative endonuclease
VYILANRSHTIYTGVTNDLENRVRQHKAKEHPSCFTARYNITRLVYYEEFPDAWQAIEWEKRIKGWVRAKKVALIIERNKYWRDLAAD